ncbi:FecR family protein [Lysobacter cavernae]|uniref:FecR family protein n=1 Tax=Lysobacter cavernae TaxID=1685901 RepID=A0ABV7RJW2_9GAMM
MSTTSPLHEGQAEAWLARLLSPECSAPERTAFEDWLAQSPGNIEAYLEAERIHALAASLSSDELIRAAARSARRKPAAAAPSRRRWQPLLSALAAALVVTAGAAFWWLRAPQGTVEEYAAARGEQREVVLNDGTVVLLDTESALVARFDGERRLVELQRGRAQFVVGLDRRRPFLVRAGASTVRDIGTTFQVSRLDETVNVGLLDGSVEVAAVAEGTEQRRVLVPGEQITVEADGTLQDKRPLDLAVASAWPQGDLVFKQQRLDRLLEEMNRYSSLQLRLGDPALAGLEISGVFHVGDQTALAAALERGWSLRTERIGQHEIVLHGPPQ